MLVQSLSHARLFETPWTAADQASLSFTISKNLFKLMPTESMTPWLSNQKSFYLGIVFSFPMVFSLIQFLLAFHQHQPFYSIKMLLTGGISLHIFFFFFLKIPYYPSCFQNGLPLTQICITGPGEVFACLFILKNQTKYCFAEY